MFKAKYLLFSFLLLSVAFFAAGVETTSAQVAPRTHETCRTYSPLHNYGTYLRMAHPGELSLPQDREQTALTANPTVRLGSRS